MSFHNLRGGVYIILLIYILAACQAKTPTEVTGTPIPADTSGFEVTATAGIGKVTQTASGYPGPGPEATGVSTAYPNPATEVSTGATAYPIPDSDETSIPTAYPNPVDTHTPVAQVSPTQPRAQQLASTLTPTPEPTPSPTEQPTATSSATSFGEYPAPELTPTSNSYPVPVIPPTYDPYPEPGTESAPITPVPSATLQATLPGSTLVPSSTPAATITPFPTSTPVVVRTGLVSTDPRTFFLISGKYQLVEFFAYWSPTSKSMAPIMNNLQERYKARINFVYLDVDDPANALFKNLIGNRLPPLFYLLDEQGAILHEWRGSVPIGDFEQEFQLIP